MIKQAAGCVILAGNKTLTLLRAKGTSQAGKWGLPAGMIDPGESPKQAIIRETEEETGFRLNGDLLKDCGKIVHRFSEDDHVEFWIFGFKVDEAFEPQLDAIEHTDYKRSSLEQIDADPESIETLNETVEVVIDKYQ